MSNVWKYQTKIHKVDYISFSDVTDGISEAFIDALTQDFPVSYGDANHTMILLRDFISYCEDCDLDDCTEKEQEEITQWVNSMKDWLEGFRKANKIMYVDMEN